MSTSGLSHINFHAERPLLDALLDFYCDIVGLSQGHRPPFRDFGYWLYAGDRPVVHLYVAMPSEERRTDVATTFDHIAFDCANRPEVEDGIRRHGLEYRTAVVPLTQQVQIFLKDPAGNSVELNFAESQG